MVLIDDKKYACETCIKGHRSSTCRHTDRPLFEIKKKGRPVTQCEHCRELRKTKQVHVKCICGTEDSLEPTPGLGKKGGNKVPASAAFPHGLPEDLEASVALQLLSEGLSDSDRGPPRVYIAIFLCSANFSDRGTLISQFLLLSSRWCMSVLYTQKECSQTSQNWRPETR